MNDFKNSLLSFIRPICFDAFGIQSCVLLQLLARFQIDLSRLNEHKSRLNFCEFLNPLCLCNLGPDTTHNYLRICYIFRMYYI